MASYMNGDPVITQPYEKRDLEVLSVRAEYYKSRHGRRTGHKYYFTINIDGYEKEVFHRSVVEPNIIREKIPKVGDVIPMLVRETGNGKNYVSTHH